MSKRISRGYSEIVGQIGGLCDYPVLLHTAIDARDCRALAEFDREFLGLHYRQGEEPSSDGMHYDADWLVLVDENGGRVVTFQAKKDTSAPTWPSEDVPMQMHMDFAVATVEDLERHRERVEALGARLLYDRSQDEGRTSLCPCRSGWSSVLSVGPIGPERGPHLPRSGVRAAAMSPPTLVERHEAKR